MNHRPLAAALALATVAASLAPARAADERIVPPPPFTLGDVTAGTLETTLVFCTLGAAAATFTEAQHALSKEKPPFRPGVVVGGVAYGGAAGAIISGPYLAATKDPAHPWISAVTSSLAGGLVAAAGIAGMLALDPYDYTSNELSYGLLGAALPAVTALASAITYHFVRQWECPAPAPTPTPLLTPWPSPTPPVRLWH